MHVLHLEGKEQMIPRKKRSGEALPIQDNSVCRGTDGVVFQSHGG